MTSNQYISLNRRLEKKWFDPVKKTLESKISSLISKIRDDGIEGGKRYLHVEIANYKLRQVIQHLYKDVGLKHARLNEIRLRNEKAAYFHMEQKDFADASSWAAFIQNYLKQFLLEKITFRVNETTRDVLLKVLDDAIANGWGVDETVKRLEELPFTAFQAARIVRTEINRAANVGLFAQGSKFQYELQKQWIAVTDNRTRGNPATGQDDHADHWHMNGQVVDFFDLFSDPRNQDSLNFPGDPKAKAESTINCRCRIITKPKRNDGGRLIPRTSLIHVELPRTRERQIVTV